MKEFNQKVFDLVTEKILQESDKCFQAKTQIFNTIIRRKHFPSQWKITKIAMMPTGKQLVDVKSYKLLSLLPVL